MTANLIPPIQDTLDAVYRTESRRILATLIRLLGDFDLAEDALHQAFTAALEQWSQEGVPANPRAWLVSAGRFKAIDALRRSARFEGLPEDQAERIDAATQDPAEWDERHMEDDQLRLIFTCCHPALPADARVALTLREICGLTTDEVARAFLLSPTTVAQRIVRAKAKIRDARILYRVPSRAAPEVPPDSSARQAASGAKERALLQILCDVWKSRIHGLLGCFAAPSR